MGHTIVLSCTMNIHTHTHTHTHTNTQMNSDRHTYTHTLLLIYKRVNLRFLGALHISLRDSTMERTDSSAQALELNWSPVEEERFEEEPAEEEEQVSEEEDITENDEDYAPTDEDESTDEETPAEIEGNFKSKNGNIQDPASQ